MYGNVGDGFAATRTMRPNIPKEQLDLASALVIRATARAQRCIDGPSIQCSPATPLRIGFVLAPNFTLLPFSGLIETFRQVWDDGRRTSEELCSWEVLAPDLLPTTSSCGVKVSPSKVFSDPGEFNYIAVAGGQIPTSSPLDPRTVAFLQATAQAGIPLIGICTGSFELARAGLLDGYTACVHWYHFREFFDEFPKVYAVSNQIFVVDRDRITCAGGTVAIDLAAYLIALHFGELRAARALSLMGVQRRRPSEHHQERYYDGIDHFHDADVSKAVQIIEATLSAPPTVTELASEVGTSVRQLERKFQHLFGVGPAQLSRSVRLRYGHWLVQHTARSITEIALDCGFADGSHFTRHFRKAFAATPREARGE